MVPLSVWKGLTHWQGDEKVSWPRSKGRVNRVNDSHGFDHGVARGDSEVEAIVVAFLSPIFSTLDFSSSSEDSSPVKSIMRLNKGPLYRASGVGISFVCALRFFLMVGSSSSLSGDTFPVKSTTVGSLGDIDSRNR